jgi:hypothetical protein
MAAAAPPRLCPVIRTGFALSKKKKKNEVENIKPAFFIIIKNKQTKTKQKKKHLS